MNHHVVDDAWAAPACPVRLADEIAPTPPRHHWLTPAECHPAYCRGRRADTDRYAAAVSTVAEEGDQRRRVDRADNARPGCPRPALIEAYPAPIVERCPAPWRGVDPAPAVIRVEHPAAVAIGRPVVGHTRRHPHRAVIRLLLPRAIPVKAIGAIHPGGHVACADGIQLRVAAGKIPAIPHVQRWRGAAQHNGTGVAVNFEFLRFTDMLALAVGAGDVGTAPAPGNKARAVCVDIQPVIAAVGNGKSGIGRVDFHRCTGCQRAQIKRGLAGSDLELQEIRIVLDQCNLRL